jgi:hypothetical protein
LAQIFFEEGKEGSGVVGGAVRGRRGRRAA